MAPTGKHITIYLTEGEKAFVADHSPGWIRRLVQAQMALRGHALGMQLEPLIEGDEPSPHHFSQDAPSAAQRRGK